jgi:hypothetical protein
MFIAIFYPLGCTRRIVRFLFCHGNEKKRYVAMDTVLDCGLKRIQFTVRSLYSRLERRKRGQSHAVECMVDAVHCADLARRRSGLNLPEE